MQKARLTPRILALTRKYLGTKILLSKHVRRSLLIALGLFLAFSTFILLVSLAIEKREQAYNLGKLNTVSDQIVRQLEVYAADRRRALDVFLMNWQNEGNYQKEWFELHSATVISTLPGISHIMLVDDGSNIVSLSEAIYLERLATTQLENLLETIDLNVIDGEIYQRLVTTFDGNRNYFVFLTKNKPASYSIVALIDLNISIEVLLGEMIGEDFITSIKDVNTRKWLLGNESLTTHQHVVKPFQFAEYNLELHLGYQPANQSGVMLMRKVGIALAAILSLYFGFVLSRNLTLRKQQKLYEAAAGASIDGIIILKPIYEDHRKITDFLIVAGNESADRIVKPIEPVRLPGNNFSEINKSLLKATPKLIEIFAEISQKGGNYTDTFCQSSDNNMDRWITLQAVPTNIGIALTIRDVTDIKHSQIKLVSSEARYRRLIDGLNKQFVYRLSTNGELEFVSDAIVDILGYTPKEFIVNHRSFVVHSPVNLELIRKDMFAGKQVEPYFVKYRHKHEGTRIIEFSHVPVKNEHGEFIAIEGIAQDVTVEKELQDKVSFQANHDQLTGLFNRYSFENALDTLREKDKVLGSVSSLCYVDMDNFKVINDSCGHQAGDQLLRQLSDLLINQIDQNDIVARLGGDEFAIVYSDCNAQKATDKIKNLLKNIERFRFIWDDKLFHIGASVGIVEINDESVRLGEYLKNADEACYIAKETGTNQYHIYSPTDEKINYRQKEMEWVAKINGAIENKQFRLFSQVIVPLDENEAGINYEVLLRMVDEKNEVVSPGLFIPIAERHGIMPNIDLWVIENTLKTLEQYPAHIEKLAKCSINLSGSSLSDHEFMSKLQNLLDTCRIPLDKLCFEITETSAVTKLGVATTLINSLRDQGCKFSLDDFGAGMSSFSYLKNLPVDFLKIDGCFVRDMMSDPIDKAMVKSIKDIGHTMGKKTIAEFVGDQATCDELRAMGIDYAQGFAMGKPTLLTEFIQPSA